MVLGKSFVSGRIYFFDSFCETEESIDVFPAQNWRFLKKLLNVLVSQSDIENLIPN